MFGKITFYTFFSMASTSFKILFISVGLGLGHPHGLDSTQPKMPKEVEAVVLETTALNCHVH